MIGRAIIFSALLALLGMPSAEAAPARAEPFDICYLSETRPVVVRLRITTEGKSLHESWTHFVDTLFAKLDADKNGALDEKEQSRLRPMLMFLSGAPSPAPADLAALGDRYGQVFAQPAWLPDVIARYGLTPLPSRGA